MQIVERDLLFLNDLYYVKYINTKRVAKLFNYYNSATRRLRLLRDEGYIKTVDHLLNGEKVFCLTKRGFSLLNKNYYSLSKTDKITHALMCADFYFYLKWRGHNVEYFYVNDVYFEYSNEVGYGYNKPMIYGGFIKENGQLVRIAYISDSTNNHNIIVKIEISEIITD